jgi:hypothetical protein
MQFKHYTIDAALLETSLFSERFSDSTSAGFESMFDTVLDALIVLYIPSSCANGVS